eukprot:6461605-Amphidinium_carterae.1
MVDKGLLATVDRVRSCALSLLEVFENLPATPLQPGGSAESVLLRTHLGTCSKLAEAQQLTTSLSHARQAVVPWDKIYVHPTRVPELLSTLEKQHSLSGTARSGTGKGISSVASG